MLAFSLRLKLVRVPRVGKIGWTPTQLLHVGEGIVESQRARMTRGLNRFDVAMRPLAPRYQKRKIRKGLAGLRDMHYTGIMKRSLTVTANGRNFVEVDVQGANAEKKAIFRQRFDQPFGLSPTDAAAVDGRLDSYLKLNLRRLFL